MNYFCFIGLISGDPVNIKVKDPQPSRRPMYRYPEQAKEIIAEMLLDMEKREIIEISTAAWLSPIVLVNKPDGSIRTADWTADTSINI